MLCGDSTVVYKNFYVKVNFTVNLKWSVCIPICICLFSMICDPSLQAATPLSFVFIVSIFFLFKGYYGLQRSTEIFGKMQCCMQNVIVGDGTRTFVVYLTPTIPMTFDKPFFSICEIIGFNWLIPVASCHFFHKIFLAGWLRIFPNHWTVLEYNPFTVMNCKLFFFVPWEIKMF